ncbi:MAG: serine hydrolase [Candidatus Eisenbacteria bacterium]|uniref:Serine hydrolase n=1 Tax=Eiseniibacteriota bacterium TaxID=2212470 RepID=A0A849SP66_UNCEI|nr:serine hydrolase [Candidatus Eisenbacteria bacterium]
MRTFRVPRFLALLAVAVVLTTSGGATAAIAAAKPTAANDAAIVQRLDALLVPLFPADQPGAAILVARNGKPIYRRAFGLANLESKTPVRPEMEFRLASVTKQFTSALVMQLVEQGKLDLDADVTRYLPDFPTHGERITIQHLLTHTAGLSDLTSNPEFMARREQAHSSQQLLDQFKDKPLGFKPGSRWAYSNSGYILLGAVIEKVTGRTYAQCLESQIFAPIGMTHSRYGTDEPASANETRGYRRDAGKRLPAEPISMTVPFAAGAIVSSVDDLLKWDNALTAGKVMKPASLARTMAPVTLADGKSSSYGFGWVMSNYEGHRIEQHNGGIDGFLANVVRIPDDRLYVAMLVNDESPSFNADFLAAKLTAIAVGKPLPEPGAHSMTPEQLDRFVGVYAVDSATSRAIVRKDRKLYSQRRGGGELELFPTSDSTFGMVDRIARLTFRRGPDGKIDRVVMNQSGLEQTYRRTDELLPNARITVALTPAQIDACVGVYELTPQFKITVAREDTKVYAQATGQPRFEIFAESPTRFYLTAVDAQIEFEPGDDGRMKTMTLRQGGNDTVGKRVE